MSSGKETNVFEKLEAWIGDSEKSNWTAYSSELVAKVVLIDFVAEDWEKLSSTILNRPEYWQQRCIVSLGEHRSPEAIDILKLILLKSSYLDSRIIAIYELDWAEVRIEKKYAPLIREIINSSSEEVEPELRSLLLKAESEII